MHFKNLIYHRHFCVFLHIDMYLGIVFVLYVSSISTFTYNVYLDICTLPGGSCEWGGEGSVRDPAAEQRVSLPETALWKPQGMDELKAKPWETAPVALGCKTARWCILAAPRASRTHMAICLPGLCPAGQGLGGQRAPSSTETRLGSGCAEGQVSCGSGRVQQ